MADGLVARCVTLTRGEQDPTRWGQHIARTVARLPDRLWNNSCAAVDWRGPSSRAATGATTNPTIVGDVLKQARWASGRRASARSMPNVRTPTDLDITWQVIEEMALRGWKMLGPVFERERRPQGSPVDPDEPHVPRLDAADGGPGASFRHPRPPRPGQVPGDRRRPVGHRAGHVRGHLHQRHGRFTVPQALAVAEVVERALRRREAEGKDVSAHDPGVHPHDRSSRRLGAAWLCERDDMIVDPAAVNWAGIAVFKRAAGYLSRARGIAAGPGRRRIRNHPPLVGDRSVGTWCSRSRTSGPARFDASTVEVRDPVRRPGTPRSTWARLLDLVPDFRRAWETDGLSVAEFDTYGPDRRTLRDVHRQLLVPSWAPRPLCCPIGREAQGLTPVGRRRPREPRLGRP